jgi:hypothetical protein
MRGGFEDSPDRLLRRHLDIDLNRPTAVDGMISIIEQRLNELETAYGHR